MKHFILGLFSLIAMQSYADCPGMTVTFSTIPTTCSYSTDGGATAIVGGGSGNYSYSFVNGSFNVLPNQNMNTVTGLSIGNYALIVTDLTNACADTSYFSINGPSPLVATIIPMQMVTCNGGANGALQVIATGGTPPYTYNWNVGATTQVVTGLPFGVYVVTVVDANGCMTNVTGTVSQPTAITVSPGSAPATCGASDGIISINATGGAGSYQYSIDGGATFQTPNVFTGLPSGTYNVVVMDANGCTSSVNVTVGNASNLVVTATSTPSGCSPCNGSVTILQSGGTAPYLYEITGHPQQTSNVFTGVCPGPYVATVTDNSGCVGIYTVMVNSSGLTGATVSVDSIQHSTGYGMNNGFIDISVSGPNAPYTFSWNNGATTEDIYALTGGTYTVTITDANGDCQTYAYTVNTVQAYGWLSGYVYNDTNSNCTYDGSDFPLSSYYIIASNGTNTYFGYTNAQGYYSIWVPIGNYTIQPSNGNNLVGACASSYSITVNTNSNNGGNNFYYNIPPLHDVCAYVYSTGIVPGFNGTYSLYVHNAGNQPATGSVCFNLPSPLTYLSSSPMPTSVSNDTICFSYSNLAPGTTQYFQVYFNTPVSLPLGTPMVSCYGATLTSGTDANPACNSGCYTRIVTGSFDPNDKSVSPMGENGDGDIYVNEDEFTYLIRFQNTGTGPAVNVLVTDTLSAFLDITSLEVLDASHDYVVEMINNTLRFRFNNIMLPDSNSNEPASHGHIQFRLSTLNAPAIGQEIENTANIYFDFNEPVITNTTHNEYVNPNGLNEESESKLSIYPNPSTGLVNVSGTSGVGYYEVCDLTGRIVVSGTWNGSASIDLGQYGKGLYLIRLSQNDQSSIQRVIIR